MKKKILISLALFAVVTTLGIVMNLSETQCNHSLNGHDCSEHLAQAKSLDNKCPNCFRAKDDWNACPMCDYTICPKCHETKLLVFHNFCTHCGEIDPMAKCKNCGHPFGVCNCAVPEF